MDAQTHQRIALLSAKETLTATILHELSQPLSAAAKQIARLRRLAETAQGTTDVDAMVRGLDLLDEMIGRCILIISRIRALAIDERPVRSKAQIESIIKNAVRLIEGAPSLERVHLEVDVQAHVTITCDPVQIEQVIVNLLLNAAAAARNHARPTVTIRVLTRRTLHGRVIEVVIADNGSGLLSEAEEEMFGACVRSFNAGQGIGLAICRSLVELHDGELWHSRSPAGGASFHFTLPVPRSVDDAD